VNVTLPLITVITVISAVDGEMCLQLVGEYMLYRDDEPTADALHTVSCRLLLDIMPGLETSVIFQDNVCFVLLIIVKYSFCL